MKLIILGTVENLSTRLDGTIKVSFGTQEMTSDDAGRLFYFRGKYCKLLLTDDNIKDIEANLVSAEEITVPNKKRKSQRLRAALYVLSGFMGRQKEYEKFYNEEMEKFIESVKSRIKEHEENNTNFEQ